MNRDKLLERIAVALEELVKVGTKIEAYMSRPNSSHVRLDTLDGLNESLQGRLGEFHECTMCGHLQGIERLKTLEGDWVCQDMNECSQWGKWKREHPEGR